MKNIVERNAALLSRQERARGIQTGPVAHAMHRFSAKHLVAAAVAPLLAASLALTGCAPKSVESYLDPANPVQVELWTYYNGKQLKAFNDLVDEYNNTRGREVGVVVSTETRGGINDLIAAVEDSAQGKSGSHPMPDAFLCYADTAYDLDKDGILADLNTYLSKDDKARFVDGFLEEGDISGNGSLKLYPVSKSTETLQINKTDWDAFATATGTSLDELATVEGITAVAQRYYEWTDAQTPQPDDGKAFFGRDSLANYLLSGSAQLGHPVVKSKDGAGSIELDEQTVRALWDNYYVPLVQGWYSNDGRFRSDAVKTGDLLAYVGSSSSVAYFPSSVASADGQTHPIQMETLQNPVFANGSPSAVQQGAGCAVVESDDKSEAACVDFLNWFTSPERNTEFAIDAGYLPVTKEALTQKNIEAVANGMDRASSAYVSSLPATLATVEAGLYVNPPFEGASGVRTVLDTTLKEKAAADREAVEAAIASGTSAADAVAPYLTDANFKAWYEQLRADLDGAIA